MWEVKVSFQSGELKVLPPYNGFVFNKFFVGVLFVRGVCCCLLGVFGVVVWVVVFVVSLLLFYGFVVLSLPVVASLCHKRNVPEHRGSSLLSWNFLPAWLHFEHVTNGVEFENDCVESYVCQRRKVEFSKSSPDPFLIVSISMIVHLPIDDPFVYVWKGCARYVMCHGCLLVENNRACARAL